MNDQIWREWQTWQARENAFADKSIDPEAARKDRAYLKLKHRHFKAILKKYGKTKNVDEQVSHALLKTNTKAIEKRLYPNRIIRLTRRFLRYAGKKVAERRSKFIARRRQKLADRDAGMLLPSTLQPSRSIPLKNKTPSIKRITPRKIIPINGAKQSKGIRR